MSKKQLMHGLQLVHSKLCKNVTGSTGLHCTSSRSDHTHLNIHKYFSDDKRGGSDLTWHGFNKYRLTQYCMGHASLLILCMLKILVEYFYKLCRPRWDATVLKSRTIHIDIICFLSIWFDALRPLSTIFKSCWDDFPSSWVKPVSSSR